MSQNDLKAIWQSGMNDLDAYRKDAGAIRDMLKQKAVGTLQKVRRRMIVESLIYVVMIYAFIELFDAGRHSWYVNALGFGVIALGIVNNLVLHRLSSPRVRNEDLQQFLSANIRRLRRQLNFRIGFFILFVLAVVMLLMPARYSDLFSSGKGWLFLAVVLFITVVKVFTETSIWKKHIDQLNECLIELNEG